MNDYFKFFQDITRCYRLDSKFKQDFKEYLKENNIDRASRTDLLDYIDDVEFLEDLIYDETDNGIDIYMDEFNEWLND